MADGVNIDWSLAQPKQNYADTYANAFALGRQVAGQQIQGNALTAYAANPTAPVDPRLMAANPELGLQLQGRQQDAQDQGLRVQQATALAGGDTQGAADIAARRGATGDVMTLMAQKSDEERQAAKDKVEATAGAVYAVKTAIADPAQRVPVLQHMAQMHPEYGIDPASITPETASDANLNGIIGQALGLKGQIEMAQKEADQKREAAAQQETVRHNQADEATATGELAVNRGKLGVEQRRLSLDQAQASGPGALNDDSIDYVAHQYMLTGQLPALGYGKAGGAMRAQIINRAAQIEAETGATGADAVMRHIQTKASGAALALATKQQSGVETNAAEASRMGDLALSLAPKGGGPTGSPVVNRWIQAGRKGIAGDADVTAFDNALSSFSEKYARVMTASTGSQAATDSARKDAADRLSKYATQGQLQKGLATMKQEMEIQRQEQARNVDSLRQGIHGGQPRSTAPTGGTSYTPPPAQTAPPGRGAPAAPARAPAARVAPTGAGHLTDAQLRQSLGL